MKCNRCERELTPDNSYQYLSENLCEDCYIDIRNPAKACDPWAVYTAKRTRENAGLDDTEGLNGTQKLICEYIKNKSKVTREEIMEKFNLRETELQTHLATLRHCELVKGYKEGNTVYLVPFDYDDGNFLGE
ncbi:MAG: hypothetical protein JW967_05690 [Dehalococcoidales bacterium]|nr:hypothetical protein [Dehalococcoidales bacterium]